MPPPGSTCSTALGHRRSSDRVGDDGLSTSESRRNRFTANWPNQHGAHPVRHSSHYNASCSTAEDPPAIRVRPGRSAHRAPAALRSALGTPWPLALARRTGGGHGRCAPHLHSACRSSRNRGIRRVRTRRTPLVSHFGLLQRLERLAIEPVDGSAAARLDPFTASAVSLPSWICGRTSGTGPKKKSIRPAITSVMASAPPFHGLDQGCVEGEFLLDMRREFARRHDHWINAQ